MNAERTEWEALLEIETCGSKANAMDEGAVTLVVDLVRAFGKAQLVVVWSDAFWISAENFSLGYFVDTLGIDDDYFLKDVSDPLQTIAAILLGHYVWCCRA